MTVRAKFLLCAVAMSGLAFAAMSPAQALTMQECSAKYKEAKAAGTLNGQKWNDFRKAQCGAEATAAPAPAATEAKTAPAPSPAAAPAAPVAVGNAVFPSAIDPKYAQESPGKARLHTCVEQYKANKASNGNGGLKWIQKGGGYYSECNKHLKGPA
ncbi:MAG TPA: hypothetical protein VHB49_23230 [Bradyrhizobium sp.]|nr:hypothetical protein [Bradyrhizobium sp.]